MKVGSHKLTTQLVRVFAERKSFVHNRKKKTLWLVGGSSKRRLVPKPLSHNNANHWPLQPPPPVPVVAGRSVPASRQRSTTGAFIDSAGGWMSVVLYDGEVLPLKCQLPSIGLIDLNVPPPPLTCPCPP